MAAKRFEIRIPVQFKGGPRRGEGIIWDMSTTGARIEVATARLRPGTPVHMKFSYASEAEPVFAAAKVVRATETGFAVHFTRMSNALRQQIVVALPRNCTIPGSNR